MKLSLINQEETNLSSRNPLLNIENISISFGGIKALKDVSVKIYNQEILGIVGPNGAGKTTFFNVLTGQYTPDAGKVVLGEKEMTHYSVTQVVDEGIIRTFQNIRQFNNMTVLENVLSAFHHKLDYNLLDTVFRTSKYKEKEKQYENEALKLLMTFEMEDYAHILAKNLSYGQRKKLEIIRAVAFNPKVLLLDEPAAGLNSKETTELQKLLKIIHHRFNLTLVLIEHDMSFVRALCERLYVFNNGRVMAHGLPHEVLALEEVISAYLG